MDNTITVLQVILGILLTVGGLAKIFTPYNIYSNMPAVGWAKEFTPAQIRLLGMLKLCGGIGLFVPLLVSSMGVIAPLTATCVALYFAGAIATHFRRSEYLHMVGVSIVFLLPALLVAYGTLIGVAV
ncbi:MAG: DoxX family protein [Anaerolineae bacterium]|nr:DoxX family protein [Anaerolineae bacterium]